MELRLELGHTTDQKTTGYVYFTSNSSNVKISLPGESMDDTGDSVRTGSLHTYGNGDIAIIPINAEWSIPDDAKVRALPSGSEMWKYLLQNGASGQVHRLSEDTWKLTDNPIITVHLNREGTQGFSFSLEQLLRHKAMWLPEQDAFITVKVSPTDFKDHLKSLQGKRILERVKDEPEASLDQYKLLWTDLGNPSVSDPSWERWQTSWMETRGHLTVMAPSHGSIYKFAFDRWGNIRPDFASPHKFKLDLVCKDFEWKGQRISNGLPILLTSLEKNGQFYEVEQFVAPLKEIDSYVSGYIPGIAFSKIKIGGKPGTTNFDIRLYEAGELSQIEFKQLDNTTWLISDKKSGNIIMILESKSDITITDNRAQAANEKESQILLSVNGELKTNKLVEVILKLVSPVIPSSQLSYLKNYAFSLAKNDVVQYWEKWESYGAQFSVPEKEVNELYSANLWHALILPRHTIGTDNTPHMDIPYANTAYGQKNADWPINQAVYVDYMIYGLRGYYTIAGDELLAMFKTQQLADGRIGGFANWGVYSPGQLYAIAQNYLLSHDRQQFEKLLPYAIKTLDWCLLEIEKANIGGDQRTGLILAPLNDLSEEPREWAFTQAYFYGGLELFGRALSLYGHPRAKEVDKVAMKMKRNIETAFSRSSVKSPVVQLEDGTWINYVPTDAMTSRRLMDQWYPTDVDTGPLHLARLGAIDSDSWMTSAMLHDHEDNLFFKNQGAANEPVYLPQANAYLLRDEPEAVIRSFYSMMVSAFSYNQYTPVEHRWGHPQYYGSPSTDGAWFEIYRRMLLNELGYDTLFIGQAIPRKWLTRGQKIEVRDAPSYFGPVSYTIEGLSSNNEISIILQVPDRNPPKSLLVRFRHPESKPMRLVLVNGNPWNDYDIEKEYIKIDTPVSGKYAITAKY